MRTWSSPGFLFKGKVNNKNVEYNYSEEKKRKEGAFLTFNIPLLLVSLAPTLNCPFVKLVFGCGMLGMPETLVNEGVG